MSTLNQPFLVSYPMHRSVKLSATQPNVSHAKQKPKWTRGVRQVAMPGLRPFYSSEGACAQVDVGIADIIAELNALGCTTYVSCSGLDADHKEKRTWWRAYIGFTATPRPIILAAFRVSGFVLDPEGSRYCVRVFDSGRDTDGKDGSNARCLARWNALRRLLSLKIP